MSVEGAAHRHRGRLAADIKTPFGIFQLQATGRGLYRLCFPARRSKGGSIFRGEVGPVRGEEKAREALRQGRRMLVAYFGGRSVAFRSLPLDLTGFGNFERKVLRALARLPQGLTMSYAGLAKKVGSPRAARAVGNIMHRNRLPVILPCHRVIHAGGSLGRYSQGQRWKRRLLTLEGYRGAQKFLQREGGSADN